MPTFAPTSRLLWLAAFTVVPGFAAIGFGEVVPGVAVSLLAAVVAVVDLLSSRGGLADLEVTSVGDRIVRASKGREFVVEAVARGDWADAKRLRFGLAGISGVAIETQILEEVAPPQGEPLPLSWKAVGERRGAFPVENVFVEWGSRFGLWVRRRACRLDLEIRIYPDLRGERRGLAAVFLNRGGIGMHVQRVVGKGREFEQLREYSPGDDYADIFWKGTAKRGYPVTKTFQIERTQEVYVAVDHSRMSARSLGNGGGGPSMTQLERTLLAALSLGLVAESQGDLFGVLSFADRVGHFLRARNGKGHYDLCRDALYNLQPARVSPDFNELMVFLRTRLTRRALVVVLTDLSDELTAESFVESVRLISKQHLVVVVGLKPPDARELFASDTAGSVGDLYSALGGQFQWDGLMATGKVLSASGVQFLLPEQDLLTSEVVTRYLSLKQRQLL